MINKNNSIRDEIRPFDIRYADIYHSALANGRPIPVIGLDGLTYLPASEEQRINGGVTGVQNLRIEPSNAANNLDWIPEASGNVVINNPSTPYEKLRTNVYVGTGLVLSDTYQLAGPPNPDLNNTVDGDEVFVTMDNDNQFMGVFIDNVALISRESNTSMSVIVTSGGQVRIRSEDGISPTIVTRIIIFSI